ncbi:MAG: 50S ribosomal protein L17 [Anaerolineae bacterium]|nr:50S ribosomal protein L17 [Anaerolineae bacterium]
MRHHVAVNKLNRSSGQRTALRRNLVTALFQHERIETTAAKARAVRGQAEKVITIAKRGLAAEKEDASRGIHARRIVNARITRWVIEPDGTRVDVVRKLFDEIAPRYAERPGGYTRTYKLGPRKGDAAEMVLLELVEE